VNLEKALHFKSYYRLPPGALITNRNRRSQQKRGDQTLPASLKAQRYHDDVETDRIHSLEKGQRVSFRYEGDIIVGEILAINATTVTIAYAFDAHRDGCRTIDSHFGRR
jgi:hypothetical protein